MKGLGGLVALTVLRLDSTQVGGDVKGLGGLVALKELYLNSTLGGLVALTELILDSTQVQGGGLGELRKYQETLKTSMVSISL